MKRQIKPIVSMAIAAAFLLAACSSATPTAAPVSTTAPVETVAPAETTAAEVPTEAATDAATAEVTTEATTEMTGTVEATAEMTGTMEATPEMTGTMEATGEATMEATGMATTEPMTGTGTMTDTSMSTATKDIVQTAIDAGEFMSLTAALESAGLVETLKGEGPYTVFAPTDEAFAKIDADTLATLMEPANQAELVKILTYHVVTGTVLAADVAGMDTAETLEGSPITITVSGGDVKINDATIVMTDVVASNGVIHVIDTVLMPPDVKAP